MIWVGRCANGIGRRRPDAIVRQNSKGKDFMPESRYKKILVPLDGSGWAQRAVAHAVDLARSNEAELILLHVFRPPA